MLNTCPECELQVSDKALICPHCGYPLKELCQNSSPRKKPRKHRRLPNGFGQITEIKDKKLRKPFRVMITVGKDEFGKPICKLLKPTAYFKSYNEAYEALIKYNKDPYNPDSVYTMNELFDLWVNKHYSDQRHINSTRTFWSYLQSIYDLEVSRVRIKHLRAAIEQAQVERKGEITYASDITKQRIKIMLNLMFDYAVEYEMTDKNYAREFSLDINTETTDAHKSFNADQLDLLWRHSDDPTARMILIQCYSGWRPAELLNLKTSDVNINERTMTGGMKTKAGKDRVVPIHPRILPLLIGLIKEAQDLGIEWLFRSKQDPNEKLSYITYNYNFNKLLKQLNLDSSHRPHDGRKTFVTLAKQYNMDEYAIKRIVGHTITDLTERVYTDRNINWLQEEMKKIP